uniref:Expressed protein n=1 Tax=Oryza sativa subsp. japonica TaxID=39947 RepID=Q10IG6_ORYSJ|nr:expressed protein [Oryza sativa Japonica Group]
MAPRRCSLTGAVFFASRRRRLRRPLPPPSTPSAPAATAVPFRRWTRQSRLLRRHRPIAPPLILLASSLLPACTNAAPPQPHQSRLLRQPRPPPPPAPSTAIATAAAHSTASSRGLPHRPRMEPTSSPSGAAVKLHRCHRSIGSSPQPTSMVNAVSSTSGPTARPGQYTPYFASFANRFCS